MMKRTNQPSIISNGTSPMHRIRRINNYGRIVIDYAHFNDIDKVWITVSEKKKKNILEAKQVDQ